MPRAVRASEQEQRDCIVPGLTRLFRTWRARASWLFASVVVGVVGGVAQEGAGAVHPEPSWL
jgi:hypothetical protein